VLTSAFLSEFTVTFEGARAIVNAQTAGADLACDISARQCEPAGLDMRSAEANQSWVRTITTAFVARTSFAH
jgi:hypothetical protein